MPEKKSGPHPGIVRHFRPQRRGPVVEKLLSESGNPLSSTEREINAIATLVSPCLLFEQGKMLHVEHFAFQLRNSVIR
jgi:hypothetical protein